MDVAVTGSHGLIGSALTRSLEADGHRVRPVVRGEGEAPAGAVRWDPQAGRIDVDAIAGVEAVVHLAGEAIAAGPWTAPQRRRIRESRVQGTTLLAETLAGLDPRPSVLVSGSWMHAYGDRGAEVLTESASPGQGFLPEVCAAWEAATGAAEAAGIRTCHIRTSVVLSGDGGALPKLALPVKLGVGGRAGTGTQWLSWITLDDEVGAIRFLLDHQDVSGPVNLAGPAPATNAEFTKTLGRVLHRPTVVVIPRLLAKLPFGVGDLVESLLFDSIRLEPEVLTTHGYAFRHPRLEPALAAVLGRAD